MTVQTPNTDQFDHLDAVIPQESTRPSVDSTQGENEKNLVLDRAEFIRAWISKHQRKIALSVLGTFALIPGVLSAQDTGTDTFVALSDLEGVSEFVILDDGSLQLTMSDGSVLVVAASDVQVLGSGQILISSDAAAALLGAAEVADMALLLGGAAALTGLAVAAGGSGGASSTPVQPAPTPTPPVTPIELVDGGVYTTNDISVVARLNGTDGEKVFTIDAPNAERIELSGTLVDRPDRVILKISDIEGDNRTLTLITDGMASSEGPHRLVFDFSGKDGDANDVVTLAPDSILTGFNEIEVMVGTLNLLGVNLPAGTVFIVNSGLVLSLEQFMATASISSVTGHGEITIALDNNGQIDTLKAFLADSGTLVMIGAQVSVEVAGVVVEDPELAAAIAAITYPSIPELDAMLTELQREIDALSARTDLSVEDLTNALATMSTDLATLTGQVTSLEALVGSTSVNAQITAAITTLTTTLEAADTALGLRIDTLAGDLTEAVRVLKGEIDALADSTDISVGDLTTALATMSTNLATLKGHVTALESLVGSTPVSAQIEAAIADMRDALGAPANDEGETFVPATGVFALLAAVEARLDALEAVPVAWDDDALEFTAAEIFGEDGSSAILTSFVAGFQATIDGFDTATIPLVITTDLTVAQATALSQAGFGLDGVNVTYSISDWYTTVQSAEADLRSAQAGRFPNIRLGVTGRPDDGRLDVTGGLSVNFDLTTGGERAASILTAEANLTEVQASRRELMRELQRSMAYVQADQQATTLQLAAVNLAVVANRANAEAILAQFEMGRRSINEVLEAQSGFIESSEELIDAKTDLALSGYALLAVTGDILGVFGIAHTAPGQQ